MKLLLNTESLIPPLTGIGNYTCNLIEQLQGEDIETIECFIGAKYFTAEQALANCVAASSHYVRTRDDGTAPPAQSRLRALLNLRAGQPYAISAVYGYGYRLDVPDAALQALQQAS